MGSPNDNNINYMICVRCMTFNHAPYIVDAMNGFCMQQTNFPFVCTIFDDSSTDGEQEVIRNYLHENFDLEDKSVVLNEESNDYYLTFARHKTNKNCFFAVFFLKYNHHKLKKPKNPYSEKFIDGVKYIALCEGDDYWIESNKLQIQIDFFEKHADYSMCYTGFQTIDEKGNNIVRPKYEKAMKMSQSGDILSHLLITNFILTCTTIFRKEVFDSPWLQGFSFNHDYTYFLSASICGKCQFFPQKTAAYRQTYTGAMATRRPWVSRAYHETKLLIYNGLCNGSIPIEKKRLSSNILKTIAKYCIFTDDKEFRKRYRNIVKQNKVLWKYAIIDLIKKKITRII